MDSMEAKRKDYLSRQDAINYFTSCNYLGIVPEDEFLYQRGEADIQMEKKNLDALMESFEDEFGNKINTGEFKNAND